jgi:hypothetical protein
MSSKDPSVVVRIERRVLVLLRIGALLAITGLTLALLLGSLFAVIGGVLITSGGILLAIAMESVLAKERVDAEMLAGPIESGHDNVTA